MGWDLYIAPENITYLYEFDLVLGNLIPGMGSNILKNFRHFRLFKFLALATVSLQSID